MAERILITKLVRTNGTRADLYGKGHQYKDLTLFDLGELAAVGIDPAGLQVGQEVPCRFWALYELSDKVNKAGNPYKDILALEAIDTPATTTSTDNTAILQELRAIRVLLQVLAEAQGLQAPEHEPEAGDLDAAFPRYLDGAAVGDNPVELQAYEAHQAETGQAPASLDALRAWYAARHNGGK